MRKIKKILKPLEIFKVDIDIYASQIRDQLQGDRPDREEITLEYAIDESIKIWETTE